MLVKGTALTHAQRQLVLSAFVHRHTVENARARGVACVMCADGGPADRVITVDGHPPRTWHDHHVSAQTDQAWLADHAFHFTKDGRRLMANRRQALPAWMADSETPAAGGGEVR